jgi:hypothetical protein
VYYDSINIIFLLALALMVLGGAVYGGATFLPGAARGSVQAYAMGMIIGGITGVIIAMAGPYIFQLITGYGAPNIASTSLAYSCNAIPA